MVKIWLQIETNYFIFGENEQKVINQIFHEAKIE